MVGNDKNVFVVVVRQGFILVVGDENMKIVVVDDIHSYLYYIQQTLNSRGHEVHLIHVSDFMYETETPEGYFSSLDLDEIVKKILVLEADLVLIDHNFGKAVFNGEQLAVRLAMGPEKIVGISSYSQPYCSKSFPNKHALPEGRAVEELLKVLK